MSADILTTIVEQKWREISLAQQGCSLEEMQKLAVQANPVRGFRRAMMARWQQKLPAVIAEIKKASPSKGVIREDFDPVAIAKSYEAGGATCLSILTDVNFFQGHRDYLLAARAEVSLPVIRKDFIVDVYQVYEARAMNADCILLIVSILDDDNLRVLYKLAKQLSMDVLVEVHDRSEMERALAIQADMIGINNRNLRTFEVSLDTSIGMRNMVDAEALLITESGIRDRDDVQMMLDNEIFGFLVGEAFMREPEPGEHLQSLFMEKRPLA